MLIQLKLRTWEVKASDLVKSVCTLLVPTLAVATREWLLVWNHAVTDFTMIWLHLTLI